MPSRGPCWDDRLSCRIQPHHRRRRKTGPPWGWVDVVHCAAHRRAFTIYPPGHVPYGRVALVELAPDGSELKREPSEKVGPRASLFTAASDAAEGRRWPRESAEDPPGAVRSSQRRRVARAAAMLGVLKGTPPTAAMSAAVTEIPEGQLVELAGKLESSKSLVEWGKTVMAVLSDLAGRARRAVMDRLAVLGHLAGLWGRPYRWLALTRQLLELGRAFWSFSPGTRGTPDPAGPSGARDPTHEIGPRDPA